jgi:predicted amidohydrolase YtcJ
VPENLAEKRWPTRQELDAAAPRNPVYIRAIWGYWRGTFPLVSIANTEALRRAGITRDTVPPAPTLTIEKDGNGDPTGVIVEREMVPIAELIWFRKPAEFSLIGRIADRHGDDPFAGRLAARKRRDAGLDVDDGTHATQ